MCARRGWPAPWLGGRQGLRIRGGAGARGRVAHLRVQPIRGEMWALVGAWMDGGVVQEVRPQREYRTADLSLPDHSFLRQAFSAPPSHMGLPADDLGSKGPG
jgi:hypothetical protein